MPRIVRFAVCLVIGMLVSGCGGRSSPQPATSAAARAEYTSTAATRETTADARPGLGTRWGETRLSRAVEVKFRRATGNPFAVSAVYYNDLAGITAMSGGARPQRSWPILAGPAGALVVVGLVDERGSFLPGVLISNRWFVVGEQGRRYAILVRNRSDLRLELVLSVDGLDVIDGRPAAFRKRGYIIEPRGRLRVDGFRQSHDAVAAFRFGSVAESYANQKYGDARNVGVIGVAVFHERGTDPWQTNEMLRRLRANPFPGQFATPP
jgi:hypothetical protein